MGCNAKTTRSSKLIVTDRWTDKLTWQGVESGLVVRDGAHFCLLFLAVNHSKAGNKLGLGVGLVLGLGIRSGIVLGIGLGLGLGLVLGLGVF